MNDESWQARITRERKRRKIAALVRVRPDLRLQELFSKRVRPEVRELIDKALIARQRTP